MDSGSAGPHISVSIAVALIGIIGLLVAVY
jgi:hypothetical protein